MSDEQAYQDWQDAVLERVAKDAEITRLRARVAEHERAYQEGHPDPCTLGPLCPYCEIERLRARVAEWKAAVEGLTPGGSEYVDDPQACAAYIRERCNYPRQILSLRARVAEVEADKARLDWLEQQPGVALLNDDDGHWAVCGDGFQNVRLDNQGPLETTFIVEEGEFSASAREAIDRGMLEEVAGE